MLDILFALDLDAPDVYIAFFWAAFFVLLGVPLHEGGHYLAGRVFGLTQARFVILPMRKLPLKGVTGFIRRYAAGAAIDIEPHEILALPVWQRRVIFLAGSAVDVAVWLVVSWYFSGMAPLSNWEEGAVLGFFVRASLGSLINLVPIAAVKNDGWRFMNYDAVE